jgi:hypothetical protein
MCRHGNDACRGFWGHGRMQSRPYSPRSPVGAFPSLIDPQAAINRCLGEYNRKPKPFV